MAKRNRRRKKVSHNLGQKTISISEEMIIRIQRFADANEWSWSHAAERLLGIALKEAGSPSDPNLPDDSKPPQDPPPEKPWQAIPAAFLR